MTDMQFPDLVAAAVAGAAIVDIIPYLCRRAWAVTKHSVSDDVAWRVREGAPIYDSAGRRRRAARSDYLALEHVVPDDVTTVHGVTTTSTGREDVAVVMTQMGPVTISLVRSSQWRGVAGVGEDVARELRCLANEVRIGLRPCSDCGEIGGLHTADCDEVAGATAMGGAEMAEREGAKLADARGINPAGHDGDEE